MLSYCIFFKTILCIKNLQMWKKSMIKFIQMKLSDKKTYYPKESAGRLMAKNVPIVQIESTVGEVEKVLIKEPKKFESINYIYVVDSHDVLKGVISIRELFINQNSTAIKKIMTKE